MFTYLKLDIVFPILEVYTKQVYQGLIQMCHFLVEMDCLLMFSR